MAVGAYDPAIGKVRGGEGEKFGAVSTCVRVPHSTKPNFELIRQDLGIVLTAWDDFLVNSRLLAETKIDDNFAIEFLKKLLPVPTKDGEPVAIEEGRAFKALMDIVTGKTPSPTLPEAKGTAWGLLNAVTYYVDHVRGSDEKRLSSAWFGSGEGLKNKAQDLLVEVVS
jgi:hypothetical protein